MASWGIAKTQLCQAELHAANYTHLGLVLALKAPGKPQKVRFFEEVFSASIQNNMIQYASNPETEVDLFQKASNVRLKRLPATGWKEMPRLAMLLVTHTHPPKDDAPGNISMLRAGVTGAKAVPRPQSFKRLEICNSSNSFKGALAKLLRSSRCCPKKEQKIYADPLQRPRHWGFQLAMWPSLPVRASLVPDETQPPPMAMEIWLSWKCKKETVKNVC